MLSRATWSFLVAAGVATAACQDPTQIKVRVTTQAIPCGEEAGEVGSTVFLSGASATDLRDEVITERCEAQPGGASIGDLTYIPSGDDEARFTVEVYLGLGDRRAESCPAACASDCVDGCEGCIRASRRMSFVPHQKLLMTIVGDLACDGVCCDGGSTCVDGSCVSNEIAPCAEGDPECGDGGVGGGGGGGADEVRTVVGVYDVALQNSVTAHLLGHIEGGERRQGYVAALDATGAQPRAMRCASEGGDVTMISAVPGQGRIYALGRWDGTGPLLCREGDLEVRLDGERESQGFVLVRSLRADEPPQLHLVGSWASSSTVELADIAFVSSSQMLVVGYANGAFFEPGGANPKPGTGLLLVPLTRDPNAGLTPRSVSIFATTSPFLDIGAVGRLDQVGALVAGRMDAGQITIGIDAGSTAGSLQRDVVVALASSNFDEPLAGAITVVEVESDELELDGLGYAGNGGDGLGLLAIRHGGDISVPSVALPTLGPGCTMLPVRVDGSGDPEVAHAYGPCERMLVGRSNLGRDQDLVTRVVAGDWSFGWSGGAGTTAGPNHLLLSERASVAGMYQLGDPKQLYVGGTTADESLLDAQGFTPCDGPQFVWGDSGERPFLRCYASP